MIKHFLYAYQLMRESCSPTMIKRKQKMFNIFRSTESPSTMQMTKMLYKTEGPLVFYKGVSATVARSLAFNCIYFGLYHSIKDHYPAYEVRLIMGYSNSFCSLKLMWIIF